MGFELVYCYKCQKRLREEDFHKGEALRIGIHTTCLGCSDELLLKLTPEQRDAILNPESHAPPKASSPTKASKAATPPPSPTVHGAPAKQDRASKPIILIAALVGIALLGILLFSGRGAPKPPRPDQGGTPPPVPPPTPPLPAPPPPAPGPTAGETRAAAAKAALQKARDHEKSRPDDYSQLFRLYDQAIQASERTPYEDEARRWRDALDAHYLVAIAPVIAAIEAKYREPVGRQEYQKALELLEKERTRDDTPPWSAAVQRMIGEVRNGLEGNYLRLEKKALEAKKAGDENAYQECLKDLDKWGVPDIRIRFEKALGARPGSTTGPGELGPFELDGAGFIRNWQMAGPFPNPNWTGLRFDFLKGEEEYLPAQGREFTSPDGTRGKWLSVASPGEKIDVTTVAPHMDGSRGWDLAVVYAACWLECDGEKDVEIRMGSDEGYRLVVDGRLVAEKREKNRKCERDQDRYPLKLAPGKRRILLKVANGEKEFEFMMRVVTPDGAKAQGIKVWN